MCQEKVRLAEFGDEVVLCCDIHLTDGLHYDQLQNVEWRIPGAKVAQLTSPPKRELIANAA